MSRLLGGRDFHPVRPSKNTEPGTQYGLSQYLLNRSKLLVIQGVENEWNHRKQLIQQGSREEANLTWAVKDA